MKHNEVAFLPVDLGKLKKLKKFDISFNMVTHLPFELGDLHDLKTLDVSRNPLIIPPRPVVDKGTIAILDYLAKNKVCFHSYVQIRRNLILLLLTF
jgi:hypothetical protein